MKRSSTRPLVTCAMIAAVYTAVNIVLLPLSFGAVQVRLAEALTLLPVFGAMPIIGLTLGCALSNAIGFAMGANILGIPDILFGTLATLLAAWLSYLLRNFRFKNLPVASAIPPVLINGVVIGLELMLFTANGWNAPIFLINFLQVSLGQLIACFALGLPLVYFLEKLGLYKKFE